MTEDQNFYADSPWTWREKWRDRLFPSRPCQCPMPEKYHAEDVVVIRTCVSLSLLDRFRVLLTGAVIVETRTATEHIVGQTETTSVAYPSLPFTKVRR